MGMASGVARAMLTGTRAQKTAARAMEKSVFLTIASSK
jgi:hypothetical protein